jgi:hypothetical protein
MESRPTKEELQRKNIILRENKADTSTSTTVTPAPVGLSWTSRVTVAEDWINPVCKRASNDTVATVFVSVCKCLSRG